MEENNAVAGLVEIDYGIAVVPKISSLKHFNVKVLPINNPSHERYIYIYMYTNTHLTINIYYNVICI